ncbi:hypothetical protein PUN28_009750 [Cardiocondyla obscurior]|uniref:Uncharacterized protein n=1 Tax=Cardiocondyla obscurior TaxID=286306 RepID=A0AAW2FPR0_9HYME
MCSPCRSVPQPTNNTRDIALLNSTHTFTKWLDTGRCVHKVYRRHRETRDNYCLTCALDADRLKINFVFVTGHYLCLGSSHDSPRCYNCRIVLEISEPYQDCDYCRLVRRDFSRYLTLSEDRVYLQNSPVEIFIETLTTV